MLLSQSSASGNSPLSTTPTTPFWQADSLIDPLGTAGQVSVGASNLAFIDTRLADYQILEQGMQPGTITYELNPQQDELAQITQVLGAHNNISSLSIFSHGNEGSLQLGDINLNLGDLGSYASEIHSWKQALAPGADLLFYGCNVAAGDDGKEFVQQIHQITGADVAASTDLTGNAAQGGNWTLEYQTGKIDQLTGQVLQPWAQAAYDHVLQTFTVTNTNDTGAGSLRQAIADATLAKGDDTIQFQLGAGPQTITLNSQLEINDITGKLTINGLGAANLTLSGNNQTRVFQIDAGSNVDLEGLAIANGNISVGYGGGGIDNSGNLTVTNSLIQNNGLNENLGQFDLSGGGIYNTGTLTLTGSIISRNRAIESGGGIYNRGTVTVSNSTLSGNEADTGGGICNSMGTVTVSNSTLSGNVADSGGGICNSMGTVTVSNSTLSGNSAANSGGGIVNYDTLILTSSTFSDNMGFLLGGGIFNAGQLSVDSSTFSSNWSASGGGIDNIGGLIVTNSTFSGNSSGGAIVNHNTLIVSSSTVSGNSGFVGGIYNGYKSTSGFAQVQNTIIAGNTGSEEADVSGDFNSLGYNLIGNNTGSTGFSNGVNGDLVGNSTQPINPLLGPLQDNGGPTFTMALLPGSPAIHAGTPFLITYLDQRGLSRSLGGGVDIGAYNIVNSLQVNTTNDENISNLQPGDLSLREAILAIASGGTITFGPGLSGKTLGLTLGELDINKNLTIQGLGADQLTISGNHQYRDFAIAPSLNVTIAGLTLTDGFTNENGGDISNYGYLTLLNDTLSNNQAYNGGAIFNNASGNLTLSNDTLSSNTATYYGGAVVNLGGLNAFNSTFSGNKVDYSGGAIWNVGSTYLMNDTIAYNSAYSGGGVSNSNGTTQVRNTIIANNSAPDGTDVYGNFTSLGYNLIGDDTGSTGFMHDILIPVFFWGWEQDIIIPAPNGDQVGSSGNPKDPKLGPLQNNGGSTFTHALLSGSPAINAADPVNILPTDQRGVVRPQQGRADIGAFEQLLSAVPS